VKALDFVSIVFVFLVPLIGFSIPPRGEVILPLGFFTPQLVFVTLARIVFDALLLLSIFFPFLFYVVLPLIASSLQLISIILIHIFFVLPPGVYSPPRFSSILLLIVSISLLPPSIS
jgi:hypothetical protein